MANDDLIAFTVRLQPEEMLLMRAHKSQRTTNNGGRTVSYSRVVAMMLGGLSKEQFDVDVLEAAAEDAPLVANAAYAKINGQPEKKRSVAAKSKPKPKPKTKKKAKVAKRKVVKKAKPTKRKRKGKLQ